VTGYRLRGSLLDGFVVSPEVRVVSFSLRCTPAVEAFEKFGKGEAIQPD